MNRRMIAVIVGVILALVLGPLRSHARYLNPNTGRFQTMDSYEGVQTDPLSLHKYLYAHADPVNGVDPSGRFTTVEVLTTVSIVAVVATTSYAIYTHVKNDATVDLALAQAATLARNASATLSLVDDGLSSWSPMRFMSPYLPKFDPEMDQYVRWFGTFNRARKLIVEDCFLRMQQILAFPDRIKWHRTSMKVFAYVYPGGPVEIWFGPLFWKAPMTGTDSKAGTIIHELSHELGVTQDHAYGTAGAGALAQSNPDLAIRNADNYEYFAEGAP